MLRLHAVCTTPHRCAAPSRRPRHRCVATAGAGGIDTAVAAALALLLSQSDGVPDLYAATPDTAAAVDTLARSQRAFSAADAAAAVAAGDGTWEVMFAPHMRTTAVVGARVQPVRYVLSENGRHMRSDVRYTAPLLGSGWLSAEGSVAARADGAVDVLFSSFWAEGDAPQPRADNPFTNGQPVDAATAAINAIGRAAFFPDLSRFPVRFMDAQAGLCVFEFPPLRTVIAARRVSPLPRPLLPPA